MDTKELDGNNNENNEEENKDVGGTPAPGPGSESTQQTKKVEPMQKDGDTDDSDTVKNTAPTVPASSEVKTALSGTPADPEKKDSEGKDKDSKEGGAENKDDAQKNAEGSGAGGGENKDGTDGKAQDSGQKAQEGDNAGGDPEDNLDVDAENRPKNDGAGNNGAGNNSGELATDNLSAPIRDVALNVQGDQPVAQEGGQAEDANRAFDTLDDLAELDKTKWNAETNKPEVGELVKKQRNALIRVRTGNLYKAVIFAKMLEKGERPAATMRGLQKKQGGKTGPGRFSRFMNASEFDKADKVMTRVNAVSGLAATADEGYSNSVVKSAVGLVTDFVKLVGSIRGIFNKIKAMKSGDMTKKRSKIFTVIGIIGDFLTAISKAASIAKTLIGWTGVGNKFKAGDVATFVGLGGQVAGVANLINSIEEIDHGIRELKADQAEERETVLEIVHRPVALNAGAAENGPGAAAVEDHHDAAVVENGQNADGAGNGQNAVGAEVNQNADAGDGQNAVGAEVRQNEDIAENNQDEPDNVPVVNGQNPAAAAAAPKAKGRLAARRERRKLARAAKSEKKAEAKAEKKEAKAAKQEKKQAAKKAAKVDSLPTDVVLQAFDRKDISEEDKAVLASYLGRQRTIAKRKLMLSNAAIGLFTSAFGIGASISGGVASINGQKKAAAYQAAVKEAEEKGEEKPLPDESTDPALTGATALGGMANANMLLTAGGMHFAKKRVNGQPNQNVGSAVRDGLWGALHNLGSDNKNGLRAVAATLDPETVTNKDLDNAEGVIKKYDTAAKQFSGSGVMYPKLFAANDIDVFKDALIAGL